MADKPRTRHGDFGQSAQPPAPRLVGIELHPGPSTTASSNDNHVKISPAVSLFRDGLELVFSFLDGSSWLRAARSCRRWFTIAASSHQTFCIRRVSPRIKPKQTFWQRLFGKKKENSDNEVTIVSPWQLASHINELIFAQTDWSTLCWFVKSRKPPLTQLARVTVEEIVYEKPPKRTKQENGILAQHFPPTLTSIALFLPFRLGLSPSTNDSILNTLSACRQLNYLVLPFLWSNSSSLSCLRSLVHLRHLFLSVHLDTPDDVDPTIDLIGSFTQLEHLDLRLELDMVDHQYSPIPSSKFHVLHLPHLRVFHAHMIILTSETFYQFSINLPQLEVLSGDSSYSSEDLLDWSQLKQLRHIQFHYRPTLAQKGYPPPAAAALGRQLASMANLSEILFHHWWPYKIHDWETSNEPEFWHQLAQNVGPHLTSLHFHVTNGFNLFGCLGDVASSSSYDFFRVQLKSLKIETAEEHPWVEMVKDIIHFINQLPHLTGLNSLTMKVRIDSAERFESIYHRFNDPTFLPHISQCEGRFSHMHWLQDKGMYSDTLTMKYNREDNLQYVFTRVTEVGEFPYERKPPAPRLVGIEPNPGPPQSPFASFFNDGLVTIFA